MRTWFFHVLMLISTHPESQASIVNASERFVARQGSVRERRRSAMRRRMGRSARVMRVQSRAMKAAVMVLVTEECRLLLGNIRSGK